MFYTIYGSLYNFNPRILYNRIKIHTTNLRSIFFHPSKPHPSRTRRATTRERQAEKKVHALTSPKYAFPNYSIEFSKTPLESHSASAKNSHTHIHVRAYTLIRIYTGSCGVYMLFLRPPGVIKRQFNSYT